MRSMGEGATAGRFPLKAPRFVPCPPTAFGGPPPSRAGEESPSGQAATPRAGAFGS